MTRTVRKREAVQQSMAEIEHCWEYASRLACCAGRTSLSLLDAESLRGESRDMDDFAVKSSFDVFIKCCIPFFAFCYRTHSSSSGLLQSTVDVRSCGFIFDVSRSLSDFVLLLFASLRRGVKDSSHRRKISPAKFSEQSSRFLGCLFNAKLVLIQFVSKIEFFLGRLILNTSSDDHF